MKMFRCQEFMTQEQQGIAEEFQNAIESEYALCVKEIKKLTSPSQIIDPLKQVVWMVLTVPIYKFILLRITGNKG